MKSILITFIASIICWITFVIDQFVTLTKRHASMEAADTDLSDDSVIARDGIEIIQDDGIRRVAIIKQQIQSAMEVETRRNSKQLPSDNTSVATNHSNTEEFEPTPDLYDSEIVTSVDDVNELILSRLEDVAKESRERSEYYRSAFYHFHLLYGI